MRGQALAMKAAQATLILALATASVGCSEPDSQVSRSTDDRKFELVLQAEKNWVLTGGALPVRVTVTSLTGVLQDGIAEDVTFVVNNGDVSPRSLLAIIAAAGDVGDEAEREYSGWITFTAARGLSSEHQGEISATFRDALVTLKIRIVPDPDTL